MSALLAYDEACRLLAEAVAVDEVLDIRSKSDAMRHYARQCKNLDAEINAGQIRLRAERRLGEMLIDAKKAGQISEGQPKKNSAESEEFSRVKLKEAGIDHKLSARAQKIADIGPVRFEALMAMIRDKAQAGGRVIVDVLKIDAENEQRDNRRNLARELSDSSVAFSGSGQKVACVYADPAWHRKQGVTNRSYENHYPTMSWDDICAMPVAERLLPDAWLFLWIPRAHMFALHPVATDFKTDDGEVITRAVKMPLAWAVARAWGFDAYSTAFIWTKTDEDHPGDQGGGVLVYDQDEVLLMFKRGRGLPKPATDEKFKSNHRERKREHSRKPDHYREMIRSMTGGVPVLELFARVDDENPLPPDWIGWGNQAMATTGIVAPVSGACCERDGAEPPIDIPQFLNSEPATERV